MDRKVDEPAWERAQMGKAREIIEYLDRLGRLTRAVQYAECLNPAQWEALRFLSQANRYSRTPGALASFLGTTKGTVSQTLSTLEEKGFVTRIRSETDRRCVDLVLTEAGRALMRQDPLRELEATVDRLDEGALERINSMLRDLLQDIQIRNQMKHFGVCWRCDNVVPLDPAAKETCSYRCGLTGEPIVDAETGKICMNFEATDPKGDGVDP
jgi:DNA-binding MarR family transcriptional regulator